MCKSTIMSYRSGLYLFPVHWFMVKLWALHLENYFKILFFKHLQVLNLNLVSECTMMSYRSSMGLVLIHWLSNMGLVSIYWFFWQNYGLRISFLILSFLHFFPKCQQILNSYLLCKSNELQVKFELHSCSLIFDKIVGLELI